MLDGGGVTPGDLLASEAEVGGDAIAIVGARGPAAHQDGRDVLLIHAGAVGQLPGIDAPPGTELSDSLRTRHVSLLLRTAAKLRSVAVNVLDLGDMSESDLLWKNP